MTLAVRDGPAGKRGERGALRRCPGPGASRALPVGARGRSTVREQVLKMPFDGATHARKWVVIECDNDPLDAPYTALHCVPARPYV